MHAWTLGEKWENELLSLFLGPFFVLNIVSISILAIICFSQHMVESNYVHLLEGLFGHR